MEVSTLNFGVVGRLKSGQIKALHEMYQVEWWTKERTLTDVQIMLDNSDVIVAFVEGKDKELIAFARILTDYVYKAIIFDVIVKPSYRGRHLGNELMNTIIDHPSLSKVKHFELYCRPEMIAFYEKWGFTKDLGELHFMRCVES